MRTKLKVYGFDEFINALNACGESAEECAKRAVYDGAAIVAAKVKSSIEALPVDEMRYVKPGVAPLNAVTASQKKALLDGLGIASLGDVNGKINTVIGFDGYAANLKYAKGDKGLPIPLLAAAVNSGSSYREGTQFFTKAVQGSRNSARKKMGDTFNKEIENTFKKNGG